MNQIRLNAGDRCGAYRITRFLGSGRTAEVYEAAHIETEQTVVIRRLRGDLAGVEAMRRRTLDEAAVLTKAQHVNVAAVLATGVQDGVPFSAIEHVKGGSLRERISAMGGRISVAIALCFARQIADAAAALHAAGAIHGDLRPESVLLTEIDEVKLCDLGPGAPLDAPERGDLRGDIRALGLILAEMIVGHPVEASSLGEKLADVPQSMRELIHKAVFGSGAEGFAAMDDVVTAVDGAWERLLKERRSSAGLRAALDTLANALKATRAASGDEDADKQDEEVAALLKGVLDATKGYIDQDEEGEEEEDKEGELRP